MSSKLALTALLLSLSAGVLRAEDSAYSSFEAPREKVGSRAPSIPAPYAVSMPELASKDIVIAEPVDGIRIPQVSEIFKGRISVSGARFVLPGLDTDLRDAKNIRSPFVFDVPNERPLDVRDALNDRPETPTPGDDTSVGLNFTFCGDSSDHDAIVKALSCRPMRFKFPQLRFEMRGERGLLLYGDRMVGTYDAFNGVKLTGGFTLEYGVLRSGMKGLQQKGSVGDVVAVFLKPA